MRRAVPTWSVSLVAFALASCGRGEAERVDLSLALADTEACRPADAITSVRFEALGHFAPTTPGALATFEPVATPEVSIFPATTRAFVVDARSPTFRGFGVAYRPDAGASTSILLLPLGRACAVIDPELRAPPAAAVAGLPDGSLVVAGGADAEQASRRVIVRRPGERLAEVVLGGLSTRREGASATALGDRVVFAGGALGPSGFALDSYEVYDHGARAMAPEAGGTLAESRMDHGAARLPDGRVLLVGGVAEVAGAPLDSAELLDLETGGSIPTKPLPLGRRAPSVVTLDDGSVLVLGGYEGTSTTCAPDVLVFEPTSGTFDTASGIALPAYARARAVPLPGARVAYVGDAGPGLSSAEIHVVRVETGGFADELVDLGDALPALVSVEAVPTLSGRILLTGLDSGGDPRAFLVDVGLARVQELPSLGTPTALVTLADGLAVALGEVGAVLFRDDAITPYDHPPSVLVDAELAFDAAPRWSGDDPVRFTAAADGARFDLAPHRFEDFAVDAFDVESGEAELLLVPAAGEALAIRVSAGSVAVSSCAAPRAPFAPLALERRGGTLELSAGAEAVVCDGLPLSGEVAIAVRASLGAIVRAPVLRRF